MGTRHKWGWDVTGVYHCVAYCMDCGMKRVQLEDYSTNFEKRTTYYKNHTKVKKAGQCKFDPTKEELDKIRELTAYRKHKLLRRSKTIKKILNEK